MNVSLDKKHLPTSTFACGPAQSLPSQRNACLYETRFERSHRAPDISTYGLYKETEENLRQLLNIPSDYTVLFFPGGATAAMEAVLWSLTRQSVSGLNMGAFSRLWSQTLAQRLPDVTKDFQTVRLIPHQLPNTQTSLIILTPNETSTGVQLPDDFLSDVWQHRGTDTLVAWDTTSCAGGRILPADIYDVQLFALQKCFAAGGGTCALILSPRAVARAKEMSDKRSIPYFLDLSQAVTFAGHKHQTLNTPSTINIWLTNEACKFMLANGGLKEMENLCKKHADYLLNWATKTDWCRPLIQEEKFRSFTTLTLEITDPKILDTDINKALADTGLENLQDGLKKYRTVEQNSLRIACFPFVDTNGTEQYQKLTAALDEIVRQLRTNK